MYLHRGSRPCLSLAATLVAAWTLTHKSPAWVSTLHLCTRVSIFFLLLRLRVSS